MRRLAAVVIVGVAVLALLVWFVMRNGDPIEARPEPESALLEEPVEDDAATRERVRHEDAAPAETPLDEPAPPAWDGPVATGRVVDASGAPVPGARIVSHPDDVRGTLDTETLGTEGSRSFVGKSAEDGTFELPVDPDGVSLVLTATADAGFGQVAVSPTDLETTIALVPWRTIGGRVTDIDGKGIRGASVHARLLLDALVEERTAVADENGEYEIARLPPLGFDPSLPHVGIGRHGWLIAEAEGFAPVLVGCERAPDKSGEARVTIDVTLVRGITLSGRVVDADTKQPVPGATVVCWSVEGMQGFGSTSGTTRSNPVGPRPLGETTAAEDGTFTFEHLPAQGPSGVASHNSGRRGMTLGHVAAWKPGYVHGGDEIPVRADGSELETTIELWPEAYVEGRVVDDAGEPVEGALVFVTVPERRPALNGFPRFWEESRSIFPETAADGRYRLRTVRASRNAPTTAQVHAYLRRGSLRISGTPHEFSALAGEVVQAPDLVLDFGKLPRAVLVVTDTSGTPVPGATIEGAMPGRGGRTDKDGRYESAARTRSAADRKPRPEAVIVRARGLAPQQVGFTSAVGGPATVEIVLQPGVRIAGRVVTTDGSPAEGARVNVVNGRTPVDQAFPEGRMYLGFAGRGAADLVHYGTTTVAADGSFVVEDLPDGPYHVAAEMNSKAPNTPGRGPKVLRDVRSGVLAGADDLVLTIPADDAPPTHPLDIAVADESGAPIPQCTAVATFGGVRLYAQLTSPGRLRFAALPVGEGRIELNAGGYRTEVVEPVTIDAARPPDTLSVKLSRGVVVRGTARAAAGDLPDGAFVVIRPLRGDGYVGVSTGLIVKDGTYEVAGLAPGRYRLYVKEAGGPGHSSAFVPEGGAVLTIVDESQVTRDLVLTPAAQIAVQVHDERLARMPLMGGTTKPEQARTSAESRIDVLDVSGQVVLTFSPLYTGLWQRVHVAPGDHMVRLHIAGSPPEERLVTADPAKQAEVSFTGK